MPKPFHLVNFRLNIIFGNMANHKLSQTEVLNRFHAIHGNRYQYPYFIYQGINTNVMIMCSKHGVFFQKVGEHIRGGGCPKCGNESQRKKTTKSTRFGVCIYDVENVPELTDIVRSAYKHWRAMSQRCYDAKVAEKHPTYKECEMCEEWKTFSVFLKWFEANYCEGFELDKDILFKGNKVYSPDTCCFVPHEINTLINKCHGNRGSLPIGVHLKKRDNKFVSSMRQCMKRITIGTFDSVEDAFDAYKNAKESYIKQVATKYYYQKKIDKRVYIALLNYKVEITD